MGDESGAGCPFCSIPAQSMVASRGGVFAVRDLHPLSPGHTLLIPRRHVQDWWSLDRREKSDLDLLLELVRTGIEEEHRPNGYNVGFNDGGVAGQTIFHLHVHVIPRYGGDMADPVGGLRRVFAGKGNDATDTDG